MLANSHSYFYDISVSGLKQPELFENQAEKVINEICQTVGWDTPTRICLEPVSPRKRLYSLTLITEYEGQSVVVVKSGRHVMSLLNKAKKAVKKQLRNIQYRKLNNMKSKRWGFHLHDLLQDSY